MIKFQKLVFIVIIIGVNTLLAQNVIPNSVKVDSLTKYNALILKYSNDFHSANRIGIGGAVPYSNFFEIESDFISVSWVNKDNANKNKKNVSVFTIIDMGLVMCTDYLLPEKIRAKNFLFPVFLTNSSHNFFLRGNPDYTYYNEKVGFNIAMFVKNNTNLYLFRENKWFEVVPGFGIKLYYNYLAVDIGYERKYQIIQHEQPYSVDGFFFSITGYITQFE